jgi:hypothetical protein
MLFAASNSLNLGIYTDQIQVTHGCSIRTNISIEERRKFHEETLYSLEGIKEKKSYSRK